MENKENFGTLLRAKRKKIKLTTEKLAELAAIDRTYITKIERHNKLPSIAIMQAICDKLGDRDLFERYLKTKYPLMYEKWTEDEVSREIRWLAREFREIKDAIAKLNKVDTSPDDLKFLKRRILSFGSDVNRSIARLHGWIAEIGKVKKLYPTLKAITYPKEKSKA